MKNYKNVLVSALFLAGVLGSTVAIAASEEAMGGKVAVTTVLAVAPSKSSVKNADPVIFVRSVVDEVLQVLNTNQSAIQNDFPKILRAIKKILEPKVDIETMARFVVARDIWAAASRPDQEKFEAVLMDFVVNLYGGAFKNYNKQKVDVLPFRGDWHTLNRLQVNTVIRNNENSAGDVLVAFILGRATANSPWLFQDLSVNNSVDLLTSVQQQIQEITRKLQAEQTAKTVIKLSVLTDMIDQHNKDNGGV